MLIDFYLDLKPKYFPAFKNFGSFEREYYETFMLHLQNIW